jgi:REP-associated tyrosine transposase
MSNPRLPKRKRIRLPAPAYLEAGSIWHVTVATHRFVYPPFLDPAFALEIADTITVRITKWGGLPHLFCLMPDHVHLIFEVRGKGLTDLVRDFKSVTTRVWWGHGGHGSLWQRSFHDRGLRSLDQIEAAVAYILMNPVKAGFVENWDDYPWIAGEILRDDELPTMPARDVNDHT